MPDCPCSTQTLRRAVRPAQRLRQSNDSTSVQVVEQRLASSAHATGKAHRYLVLPREEPIERLGRESFGGDNPGAAGAWPEIGISVSENTAAAAAMVAATIAPVNRLRISQVSFSKRLNQNLLSGSAVQRARIVTRPRADAHMPDQTSGYESRDKVVRPDLLPEPRMSCQRGTPACPLPRRTST